MKPRVPRKKVFFFSLAALFLFLNTSPAHSVDTGRSGLFVENDSNATLTTGSITAPADATQSNGLHILGETVGMHLKSSLQHIEITSNVTSDTVYGVFVHSEHATSTMTVEGAQDFSVTISGGASEATGLSATSNGGENATLSIQSAQNVAVNVSSAASKTNAAALEAINNAEIQLNADNITLSASNSSAIEDGEIVGGAFGVYAGGEGASIEIHGNIKATVEDRRLGNGNAYYGKGNSVVALNGGSIRINAEAADAGKTTILDGNIEVSSDAVASDATIGLRSANSSITGFVNVDADGSTLDIIMDAGSRLILKSLYGDEIPNSVSNLTINGGTIDLSQESHNYQRLLVRNRLSGSSNIVVRTDIAAGKADQVEAKVLDGTHTLFVKNSGADPNGRASTWLVRRQDGSGTVVLGNPGQVVEIGTYKYFLNQKQVGSYTQYNLEIPQIDFISTEARNLSALLSQEDMYAIRNEQTALISSRNAELLGREVENGLWMRGDARQSRRNGFNGTQFQQYSQTVAVGYDRNARMDDSHVTLGVAGMVSKATQSPETSHSGEGNLYSKSLALYGNWQLDNGWYASGIASLSWFTKDISGHMIDGSPYEFDYSTFGAGLTLEGGKVFTLDEHWSIAPFLRLDWDTINGTEGTTNTGMKVDLDNSYHIAMAAGAHIGYSYHINDRTLLTLQLKPFLQNVVGSEQALQLNSSRYTYDPNGINAGCELGAKLAIDDTVNLSVSGLYQEGLNQSDLGITVWFGVNF